MPQSTYHYLLLFRINLHADICDVVRVQECRNQLYYTTTDSVRFQVRNLPGRYGYPVPKPVGFFSCCVHLHELQRCEGRAESGRRVVVQLCETNHGNVVHSEQNQFGLHFLFAATNFSQKEFVHRHPLDHRLMHVQRRSVPSFTVEPYLASPLRSVLDL